MSTIAIVLMWSTISLTLLIFCSFLCFLHSFFHTGQGFGGSGVKFALVDYIVVAVVNQNIEVKILHEQHLAVMLAGQHEPL